MKICLYCTCLGQNSRILSVDALRAALPNHIRLLASPCLCRQKSCEELKSDLAKEKSLHIVLAACTARARGKQALSCLAACFPSATLTLFPLREHCLWTAENNGEELVAQVRAGILGACTRLEHECPEPSWATKPAPAYSTDPACDRILVIGAGPAGMAAASGLVSLGHSVTLVEKKAKAGGLAGVLGPLFPALTPAQDILKTLDLSAVSTIFSAEVSKLSRQGHAFRAQITEKTKEQTELFDAVILATGAQPVLAGADFGAPKRAGIMSQLELDTLLTAVEGGKKDRSALPARTIFVQCVQARSKDKPYCSAICCPTAVKNALRIKKLAPEHSVTVLARQVVMPGKALEDLYQQTMRAGVRFVHLEDQDEIVLEGEQALSGVRLERAGTTLEHFSAERLVCSTPLLPPKKNLDLTALGLRRDTLGFVHGLEPLDPQQTSVPGLFVCGSARWPVSVEQAISQGRACAVCAHGYLSASHDQNKKSCARIQEDLCSGCGRCVRHCPHGACQLGSEHTASVTAELCQACGVCRAVCPSGAAQLATLPSAREILVSVSRQERRSL